MTYISQKLTFINIPVIQLIMSNEFDHFQEIYLFIFKKHLEVNNIVYYNTAMSSYYLHKSQLYCIPIKLKI